MIPISPGLGGSVRFPMDSMPGEAPGEATGAQTGAGGVEVLNRAEPKSLPTWLTPLSTAEAVERVHAMPADKCPVYRTLSGCIDITTEVVVLKG